MSAETNASDGVVCMISSMRQLQKLYLAHVQLAPGAINPALEVLLELQELNLSHVQLDEKSACLVMLSSFRAPKHPDRKTCVLKIFGSVHIKQRQLSDLNTQRAALSKASRIALEWTDCGMAKGMTTWEAWRLVGVTKREATC